MQGLVKCPCGCGRDVQRYKADEIKANRITHTGVYSGVRTMPNYMLKKIVFTRNEAEQFLDNIPNSHELAKNIYSIDSNYFADCMEEYLNKHFIDKPKEA